ncbi:MAG: hypothetical protein HYU66_24910 [Armatimonadetes bacterium]|nr:hypothetical protein [Armatimonadota bacterium]
MTIRQSTFVPSLLLSALLNTLVFAVLSPVDVHGARQAQARFRLHRLARLATDATRAEQPAAVLTAYPQPARMPVATRPIRTRAARREGRGSFSAGSRHRVAASGGDGTRVAALVRDAGGGALRATPPPGDPRPAAFPGPALVRTPFLPPPTLPPAALPTAPVRDAPPLISPGLGPHGGTPGAPRLGPFPAAGTAGSGDRRDGLAPLTTAGFGQPLAPTTPGPRLREKAGTGLPSLPNALEIAGAGFDPRGHSGGGGGTALTPGEGGGGPPLAGADPLLARTTGGGGSGRLDERPDVGGVKSGAGPGGGGGGGNGLAETGNTGDPHGSPRMAAVPSVGAPSIVARPGHGSPAGGGPAAGKRAPGPGGPAPASLNGDELIGGPGGPGGPGRGKGKGHRDGDGDGSLLAARVPDHDDGGGYTGVIIDSLGLQWHHIPGSYDLHVGSVDGPRLAVIGVYHYRSVASAKSSVRVQRGGRRQCLTIRPLAIEYVVRNGEGARNRVAISSDDAAALRESGLLRDRDRILTVYRDNY